MVLILDLWSDRNQKEDPELSLLKAELFFCIQYEMVCTLQDFFVRRTGLINFDIQKVVRWKSDIAEACKTHLHWKDEKVTEELNALNLLIASITRFA